MNVLHVIPAVAPRYGGPSEAVIRTCHALGDTGIETSIVTTDADGPGRLSVAYDEPVDYRRVPTRFFPRQYSEAFKYSPRLARWVGQHVGQFDVVHIHAVFSHSSLAAAAAAQRAGVPYIVRPLGSLAPWSLRQRRVLKKILWRAGVGRMLRGAMAIHCTSQAERSDVQLLIGRGSGQVIPLGVDLPPDSSTDQAARKGGSPARTGDLYVLVLGRIHPKKGLDLLLPAFLELARDQFSDWRLVLAGDGDSSYIASLQRHFGAHPAWDRVEFTGWVDGERKSQLLRHAALLAMPSHQENFGLAAFEALAHGVPVLVSSCIDVADEIRDAHAGWIADLTPASLRASLAAALTDAGDRAARGAHGRALVAERYTWAAVAERLSALYQQISSTRGRPEHACHGP